MVSRDYTLEGGDKTTWTTCPRRAVGMAPNAQVDGNALGIRVQREQSPRVATRGLEYPMNLRHPIFVSGIFTALCGIFLVSARADVYELSSGGQVVGELIRREETPKQRYVIQTVDGATVTIDRSQIKQVVSQTPAELEYQKIKPTYPDTAEGQTQLADWCRDNNLPQARAIRIGKSG